MPRDFSPDQIRQHIDAAVERFFDTQQANFSVLGPDAETLIAQARSACAGGKRLRANFALWGYRSYQAADSDALWAAGAALELLHASALVHDDVMDDSDTRRGRPSTHRLFAQRHRAALNPGDAEAFGDAAAILLGDLLLCWADELLHSALDQVPQFANEARRLYEATKSEVTLGQFLDVSVQARGQASVTEAMRVLRFKSAKYSVERPLHVGAALAGADHQALAELSAFGIPIGEAFQLRDDVLGVFGDPAVTGKPAGDDLAEGKRTVLIAHALSSLDTADTAALERNLGRALTAEELADTQQLLIDSGALGYVEDLIANRREVALAALESSTVRDEAKTALTALAYAATAREH